MTLERIEPAVDRLIAHVEEGSDFVEPDVSRNGTDGVEVVGPVEVAAEGSEGEEQG